MLVWLWRCTTAEYHDRSFVPRGARRGGGDHDDYYFGDGSCAHMYYIKSATCRGSRMAGVCVYIATKHAQWTCGGAYFPCSSSIVVVVLKCGGLRSITIQLSIYGSEALLGVWRWFVQQGEGVHERWSRRCSWLNWVFFSVCVFIDYRIKKHAYGGKIFLLGSQNMLVNARVSKFKYTVCMYVLEY